jgi:hypothetical protein
VSQKNTTSEDSVLLVSTILWNVRNHPKTKCHSTEDLNLQQYAVRT